MIFSTTNLISQQSSANGLCRKSLVAGRAHLAKRKLIRTHAGVKIYQLSLQSVAKLKK